MTPKAANGCFVAARARRAVHYVGYRNGFPLGNPDTTRPIVACGAPPAPGAASEDIARVTCPDCKARIRAAYARHIDMIVRARAAGAAIVHLCGPFMKPAPPCGASRARPAAAMAWEVTCLACLRTQEFESRRQRAIHRWGANDWVLPGATPWPAPGAET